MKRTARSSDTGRDGAGESSILTWQPVDSAYFEAHRVVRRPVAQVEFALRNRPQTLLARAHGARPDGDGVVLAVSMQHLRVVRIPVHLRWFSAPSGQGIAELTWEAQILRSLFPTLEATLSARPESGEETVLQLRGHYRLPGGLFGLILDRIAGRKVASETLRHFLDDLASELEHDPPMTSWARRAGSTETGGTDRL